MRKIMFAALAVAALAPTGCIFVSDNPRGQFGVTWVVTLDNAEVDCSAVGAANVEVDVTGIGSTDQVVKLSPCSAGGMTTDKFEAGDYVIDVTLLDSNGVALSETATFTATIVNDGQLIQLTAAPIEFAFNTYRLTFDVRMGDNPGDNCDSTTAGGAGVAQEQIILTDEVGGFCLNASITGLIDENNLPLSASTCENVVCQPLFQAHQINGLSAGKYYVQVIGYKGALDGGVIPCYRSALVQVDLKNSDDIGTITADFDDTADPTGCNATKPTPVASR